MDALIGTFHIDWKLMIAQIINFSVVFFVLYRFALKPLSKVLSERKATIEKGVSDAQKNQELLKDAQTAHEKELARGRAEAHDLMTEVKKSAEEKKVEIIRDAQEEVSKMIALGKKSIEEEKQKMVDGLQKEIATIVLLATEKVVGNNLSEQIQSDILKKSINEVQVK